MPDRNDTLMLAGMPINAVIVYGAFVPNLFQLRQIDPSSATISDVRMGYRIATALTLSMGIVTSAALDSLTPALVSVAIAVAMILLIEQSLATPSASERESIGDAIPASIEQEE